MPKVAEQLAQEIAESGLFDAAWYADRYSDVAFVDMEPLEHFVRFGLMLKRNPGPDFDAHRYLDMNGDVAVAGLSPLLHYIRFGRAEGREAVAGKLADIGSPLSAGNIMPHGPRRHAGSRKIDPGKATILLCAHSADSQLFGGERSLLDVLQALSQLPLNMIVTLPSDDNRDYFDQIARLSAFIYTFPYRQWMESRDAYAWSALDFADIIARHAVDIVHANTVVLLESAVAAEKMGRTSVIHARELISLDAHLQRRMDQTAQEVIDTVLGHGDWIIGNSLATCRLFHRADRTLHIPNAVAVDDFAMPNIVDGDIRFGIVSSNLPKKGITDFVEVARRTAGRAPRAKFVIIGPPTHQIDLWLQEIEQGQRPDNIVFAGYKENGRAAMAEINVLLNLSTFGESFGRTVAEAMAAKRPVIAYRWGALPEVVQDGEGGRLVAFRDIDGVVDAVVELCERNALIGAMGERGHAFVTEHFSQQMLLARLSDAYERIAERPMRPGGQSAVSKPTMLQTIGAAPPVTIIIPVFNALEEVRACIASVLKHTDFSETELIIIDDASSDPAIAPMLAGFEGNPRVRIVRSPTNQGYTPTINLGIEMAAGRDVILLNSDTIVTPRWVEGLRATAYSRPKIATATAMSDNAGAFSFPIMEQPCAKPSHMTHEEYALRMVQGTFDCPAPEVPTASGFCMFIRRTAIDAHGVFDAQAFPRGYGEENDFCMRLLNAGWTHLISPWSFVFHVRSASFKGEKDSLSKAGMDVMDQRYPDYRSLVQAAFLSDPVMAGLRDASARARDQMLHS